MDDLGDYSDSSENEEALPDRKRPPPPSDLLDDVRGKRPRRGQLALPNVVPVRLREDKFLVHVYLPIAHAQLDAFVNRLMGLARLQLTGGKVKAAFAALTDFHVTIARPVVIREAQIPDMVAGLNKAMRDRPRIEMRLRRKVEAFLSGNGRRVFVAAPVSPTTEIDVVVDLIKAVDKQYEKRGLPVFFKNPRPHMSFASTEVIEVQSRFCEATSRPDSSPEEGALKVVVNRVECMIGKSKYYFPLL